MRLHELRDTTLDWFIKKMPDVPKYVVQDFIYKNYKNEPNGEDAISLMKHVNSKTWKQEKIKITMNVWDADTQRRLKEREGGSKNPYDVPNDAERHAKQKELIAKGPASEPIIVYKTSDGYELIEGWHRTMQSMEAWPEGYEQIAWVGT